MARSKFFSSKRYSPPRFAAIAPRLGQGQRRSDGGVTGVVDGFSVDIVHLHGVRCCAVDKRSRAHGGRTAQGEACAATVQVFGKGLFQQRGRGLDGARQQRRVPVHDGALGVVDDFGSECCLVQGRGELGKTLGSGHGCQR